jgi:hypothetical protein
MCSRLRCASARLWVSRAAEEGPDCCSSHTENCQKIGPKTQSNLNQRQLRWMKRAADYDCEILRFCSEFRSHSLLLVPSNEVVFDSGLTVSPDQCPDWTAIVAVGYFVISRFGRF